MLCTDKNSAPFAIVDFKERSQKEYIIIHHVSSECEL